MAIIFVNHESSMMMIMTKLMKRVTIAWSSSLRSVVQAVELREQARSLCADIADSILDLDLQFSLSHTALVAARYPRYHCTRRNQMVKVHAV
eukprot:2501905-Rhodomonas_salina.3